MGTPTSSGHGPAETYVIPGTSSNPYITFLASPEEIDYMGNEVAPELVYDQGLYYPAANYYGYYCTGPEAPGEWNDHHRFFGLDGQELHYSGSQTENSPYVYFPPTQGYAHSYNPFNPYIPGAVIGLDSPPFLGTQQYFTNPLYQSPYSSPNAYIPVAVHPSSDAASSFVAPFYGTASSISSREASAGGRGSQFISSSDGGATSLSAASGSTASDSSQSYHQVQAQVKSSERFVSNGLPSKQPSLLGSRTSGSTSQMTQGRNSSGLMQPTDHVSHGRISSIQNPFKVAAPTGNTISNIGSNIRGWTPVDRFRPRFNYSGQANIGNGSPDTLGEQNRGPRTNRSKGQSSTISEGTYLAKAGAGNTEGTFIIYADDYNRDDFPVDYPDAKFFVIKSYSEDDVHKSIKYNVWSSTPNGNRRLDTAFEDAQRISAGKPRNCAIFLFFSVNASGQFCGVAEMTGPVDFHKDMDFWHQDKWTGSFPVKWHIIKDVPNTSFRHITLENNENKPVTNSRDTQEITYIPGINMLKIFKNTPLKTSILDDFIFYEERQKSMLEEKSRFLGRSLSTYFPAIVYASKTRDVADQKDMVMQPVKEDAEQLSSLPVEDGGQASGPTEPPPKTKSNQEVNQPPIAEDPPAMPTSSVGDAPINEQQFTSKSDDASIIEQQFTSKPAAVVSLDDKKSVKAAAGDANVASAIVKMKLLSVDSEKGKASSSGAMAVENTTTCDDVVTVGSVHIKVNGNSESSSKIMTIGKNPAEPGASPAVLKLNKQPDSRTQK